MDLWTVIGLAALPAAGNLAGGLLAEVRPPSQRMLNLALHAASGILFAVIAVEVMPAALRSTPAWMLAASFLAGGGVYLLVEALVEHGQSGNREGAGSGAWMVYAAVVADLLGDGLLIGAATTVSAELGIVLALGQVLADVPEGFAVIANFRDKGVRRPMRILLSASLVVPVVGMAIAAYFLLRDRGEHAQMCALVFVAGLYTLAAAEDLMGEAHASQDDTRWSAGAFLAGFAVFLVVAGTFGPAGTAH